MNKTLLSFIITTLSGISTTLGIIPCFFKAKNQNKGEIIFSYPFTLMQPIPALYVNVILYFTNKLKNVLPFFLEFNKY